MTHFMTQAQYARHRKERGLVGQTPAAVCKKIKAGQLSQAAGAVVLQDGRVLIDPEAADAQWAGNTDPALQRAQPGPVRAREERDDGQPRALGTLLDFRTKTEASKALKARIEVDQLRGMVLERAQVEDTIFQAMRVTRDQLRVLPGKLAPQLAYLETPEACRALLEREIRTLLDDLSRRFRSLSDIGPGAVAGHQPAP